MTIEIINGDLLEAFDKGEVNVIGHVVNCQGVMGGGIAKQIKQRYPEVYNQYVTALNPDFCEREDWLGKIQVIDIPSDDYRGKRIYNMFGQFDWGIHKRQLNYGALGQCFSGMTVGLSGYRHLVLGDADVLGFPYLPGCGLAGGNEDIVLELINFHFREYDVKIYRL